MSKFANCSSEGLAPQMLTFLKKLESKLGFELVITSAFRSKEFEISKKRNGLSAHCKGLAVDVVCTEINSRFHIVQNSLLLGCSRIGIAKNFIHIDLCDWSHGKNPQCIWLYD